MDEQARTEARAWTTKAEQDLFAARLIREGNGPETVGCFLCHQAIEKLLKALLVLHGDAPPRSHDLVALHRLLGGRSGDLGVAAADLAAWADYPIAARYPGFGDPKAQTDFVPLLACATGLAARVRVIVEI